MNKNSAKIFINKQIKSKKIGILCLVIASLGISTLPTHPKIVVTNTIFYIIFFGNIWRSHIGFFLFFKYILLALDLN